MSDQSLYILDGMALIYRAFYAFITSPMRRSDGLNTSAVFGLANTVLSLIDKVNPTHIVACLDASGPTFRHEQYELYKANRQAMPQELRDSIPFAIELLEKLNIPVVRLSGFEADDLIGTLTRRADEAGMRSYMVSLDKDLGQLLSPLCSFWKPGRKGADFELVTEADFLAEWSIQTPAQIIDILALMGDASDNIPGVAGVGAVTAKKLIAQFGSVDELLTRTAEIKGKMREKIELGADNLRLSYQLATIRRDVEIDLSIDDCLWRGYQRDTLRACFEEFEFKGLVKRFSTAAPASTAAAPPTAAAESLPPAASPMGQLSLFDESPIKTLDQVAHQYHLITEESAREALAARLLGAERWAFDTETTGLDPLSDRLLGISFCLEQGEAYYVPIRDASELAAFAPVFLSDAEKGGVNLKFDYQVLRHAGLELRGPFFDAMLAHSALYPDQRHGMDDMAQVLLSYKPIPLEDIAGKGKDMDTAAVPLDIMARYAAEDADISLQLCELLRGQLREQGLMELMERIEFPLLAVLAELEIQGMRVEPSLLAESSQQLADQIASIKERLDSQIGREINLNSPKQLGELLFGELKLVDKPKKTKTGQYVTDEETLRKLIPISPLVGDILHYRELNKLKGTYLDALPRYISEADGRIHASLMQMVTTTGRLACQNPNLQNIPVRSEEGKLIRRAFVPRDSDHLILSADYSQVELRLMAALSEDPSMIAAFCEGRDIHTETAARLFGCDVSSVSSDMRRAAKTVNFGIIYGISAFGLSQRLDCSRAQAGQLIESYFAQFPGVQHYMDRLVADARQLGYAETLCGRRRYLPDLNSSNFNLRGAAERNAINTPIQGSAADMIKLAMLRVADVLRGRRTRLIMQVHDELLFDLHRDEQEELMPLIIRAMQDALPLPHGVPLDVDARAATNWLDAH